jgi:hypothetical protein
MNFSNLKTPLYLIVKVFFSVLTIALFVLLLGGIYLLGLVHGYKVANEDAEMQLTYILNELVEIKPTSLHSPTPVLEPTKTPGKVVKPVSWGGPELWDAVNTRRKQFGVNPLSSRDELCTIASIRLNELLKLGTLDNHEGFSDMNERRSDLAWIFEKYSVVAEFLAMGGQTAEETVSLWENTLGHKKLLTGGEYVWGCIYAQNTFAVAITAF